MFLKDFYTLVILTEETAVAFLRENSLLNSLQEADPCHRCGSVMRETRKRDRGGGFRPVLRCPKKGCQTHRSVRKGSPFFHYTDINNKLRCNLSLCEILEIVFFFVMEVPTNVAVGLSGKSASTITDWYNFCREVCVFIISQEGEMVETNDSPTQVIKVRVIGQRKGNPAKMLNVNSASLSKDRLCWKLLREDADDLFIAFLNDIRNVHCQVKNQV